jgi:outer membrane protein
MRKVLSSLALLALVAGVLPLRAAPTGPWQARVRATYLSMADKSDAFSALALNFPDNGISVNSKLIPEFDFSYSLTANLVTELVLTIPQTQDVTLAGVGKLGTFKHLPPVLSGQYHFAPGTAFNPYVGLGVNFTLIYDTNLKVANVPLALESNSLGLAGQVGADVAIGNGMYVNFDLKKVMLRSDVSVQGGPRLSTARLDPWLIFDLRGPRLALLTRTV